MIFFIRTNVVVAVSTFVVILANILSVCHVTAGLLILLILLLLLLMLLLLILLLQLLLLVLWLLLQ